MLLLAWLALARTLSNETRFVHRHSCYGGAHNDTFDTIGCAEREATLFEHKLTPPMLWCNTTHCRTRFGDMLDVHMIDCDARRCRVLLHCEERLRSLKQAFAVTIVALILLVASMAYQNALPLYVGRHDNIKVL